MKKSKFSATRGKRLHWINNASDQEMISLLESAGVLLQCSAAEATDFLWSRQLGWAHVCL